MAHEAKAPTSFGRPPKLGGRTRRKQGDEHERTRRPRRLGVQRGDLVRTHCATEHAREDGVHIRPKRLGVRERGVDGRDERGAPQIGRRPAVWEEFGGGGEREGGRVEEGDEVSDKGSAVGDDLVATREGASAAARKESERTHKGGEEERPGGLGHCGVWAAEHDGRDERAHEHCAGVAVQKGERELRVERHRRHPGECVDERLNEDVQQWPDA